MADEDPLQSEREELEKLRAQVSESKAEYQAVLTGQVVEVDREALRAEKARLAAELKESQRLVERQKQVEAAKVAETGSSAGPAPRQTHRVNTGEES